MKRTAVADAIAALTLVVLSMGLWAPRIHGPIDLRWDAGVYYILGTSLAEGRGYRLANEPGDIEAVQYPPVLPAIVALHQRALGSSDPSVVGPALRKTNFVIFTLYLLAVHRLARRFLSGGFAFAVAAACALHAQTHFLSYLLFAELPFMLFATAFLWSQSRPTGVAPTLAGAVLGALAYGTRTAGIAVLLAWVLDALVRRQWRLLGARVLLAALPVLAWQSHIGQVRASPDYLEPAYSYQRADYHYYNVPYSVNSMLVDPFIPELGRADTRDLMDRVTGNLRSVPVGLGEALTAPRRLWQTDTEDPDGFPLAPLPAPLVTALLLTMSGLMVGGGVLLLRRGEWLLPIYLGGSVAMVCLTSWPGQFTRYFTPTTPLFALALAVALAWILEWARKSGRRPAIIAASALTTVILVAAGSRLYFSLLLDEIHHRSVLSTPLPGGGTLVTPTAFAGPRWTAHDRCLAWLRDHADPDDVVATSTPHRTYLATGLKATMPAFEVDPARALADMDTVPIRYLIVDDLRFLDVTRRYGQPVVDAFPEGWELVHEERAGAEDPDDPEAGSSIYRRVTGQRITGQRPIEEHPRLDDAIEEQLPDPAL